ncbi:hypothetical protein EDD86DRAFT_208267 [Gorgonomyces haynaldii]|nr:hypothetical protein EDD86DRAFT_208267 [Gorgonomyces haynaldii]
MHLQDSAVELSTVDLARKQALRKGKPTPHQPKEPSDRQFSFPRLHDPPENYSFDGETEKLDVDTSLAIKTLQRAITSRQMTLQRQETKPHFVQVSSDVPASKVLFSAHDIDNSGGISASELRGLVYSMGFYLSDAEAAIAVEKLDPDGDGEIQYHNFLKWWQSDNRFDKLRATQKQGELIQSATEYFQYYDIEENGYVDDAQFRKMFDDMMHYNLYFAQDTTYEQAKQQIMSKNAVHVTFNDYIAWLFRIGVIATA